jgi:multiple RNA-binding domain-containing protein 1
MRQSSRLIVKGFAPYITEDRLRAHFSKVGEVTDVRVCRTVNGRSRQFGFVGFRTDTEAAAAKAFFDQTFLDTRRLLVDFALPPKAPELDLRRQDGTRGANTSSVIPSEETRHTGGVPVGTEKGRMRTLLRHHHSASINDTNGKRAPQGHREEELEIGDYPRDAWRPAQQTQLTKIGDRPDKSHRKDLVEIGLNLTDGKPISRLQTEKDMTTAASTSAHHDGSTGTAAASGAPDSVSEDNTSKLATDVPPDSTTENSYQADRIFIRNLGFTVTTEDLGRLFEPVGFPEEVHMVKDRDSGRFLGTAFVRFTSAADALRAIAMFDGTAFQGRLLHILPAEPNRSAEKRNQTDAAQHRHSNFSNDRKRQRRQNAGSLKDTVSWNPFFVSADAVLETSANRLHVSKSKFIDADALETGASAAVRLAVAESSLLQEVRDYLVEAGVNVKTLLEQQQRQEKPLDRKQLSRTTIIVKNLPAATRASDLLPTLARYGEVGRFIIAPGGLIAIVEFLDENQAKRAFKNLAYTRYAELPLYLEWAPGDIWAESAPGNIDGTANPPLRSDDAEPVVSLSDQVSDMPSNWVSKSLLIRNLNLETNQKMLLDHIEQLGARPRVIRVPLDGAHHRNTNQNSIVLTKYAFVEFSSPEETWRALNLIHGSVLDGYRLIAVPSEKHITNRQAESGEELDTPPEPANQTKLVVKNIAFEASKRELRQLFSSFGHLKSLRLPRKFDGSGRGFCFLEYATPQESARAKMLAQGTHFYGRKLVVEYSQV